MNSIVLFGILDSTIKMIAAKYASVIGKKIADINWELKNDKIDSISIEYYVTVTIKFDDGSCVIETLMTLLHQI